MPFYQVMIMPLYQRIKSNPMSIRREEHPELEESATWTRQTIKEIQRAATEGFTVFAVVAPSVKCRILMTCYSLAPVCRVTRWKGIVRNVIPM